MNTRVMTAAALMLCCGHALGQTRIYVDIDATGADDGTSWTDAYTDLQDALDDAAATSGDTEMWVAEGTYIRSGGSAGDGFEVYEVSGGGPASVSIYGGFDGTESALSNRAGLFDTTVFSGDRGTVGFIFDNSTYVVSTLLRTVTVPFPGTRPGPDLRLDGVTVEEGLGGGVLTRRGTLGDSRLSVVNSIIQNNYGSGVTTFRGSLSNSTFENNSTGTNGGGALIRGTTGVGISTCRFINNHADGDGGALYIAHTFGNTNMFGTVFVANSAGDDGGAIFTNSIQNTFDFMDDPIRYEFRVAGCTFVDNVATNDGGAMYREGSGLFQSELGFVANSIFWKNEATLGSGDSFGGDVPDIVEYSTEDSGTSGTGNITSDPLFFDEAGEDFRLKPASPARDAGLATVWDEDPYDHDFDSNITERIFNDSPDLDGDGTLLEPVPLDNDSGRAREINSNMDMGAFECCPADSNLDGSLTSADFNAWILAFNAGDLSVADVNRDGVLTTADNTAWTTAYNAGCN